MLERMVAHDEDEYGERAVGVMCVKRVIAVFKKSRIF